MPVFTSPVVTDVGRAAALSQHALGLSLTLTHAVVGASSYLPTVTQTTLVDPRHKGVLIGNATVGDRATGIMRIARATYAGALFDVGEIGFYAGDPDAGGTLVMVLSNPPDLYGTLGGGQMVDLTATIDLRLVSLPAGSITIAVDTTSATSAAMIMEHIASTNPHPFSDGVPVGMVQMFLGSIPPRGYLPMSGIMINRADFPELWVHANAQGLVVSDAEWLATGWTYFSSGNGSTTFRLPDFRGDFPRFWDAGRGADFGRQLSSFQDWGTGRPRNLQPLGVNETGASQALRGINAVPLSASQAGPSQVGFVRVAKTGNRNTSSATDTNGAGAEMDIINVVMGDEETRGRNVSLMAIIKASGNGQGPIVEPTPAPSAPALPPAPVPSPPPAPGAPPVAMFNATPRSMYDDGYTYVTFTDLSTPGGAPIVAWQWVLTPTDAGLSSWGATLTTQNPVHRLFSGAATYDVTLTVTDSAGQTATLTRAAFLVVEPAPFSGGA
jgi:hypothetical protein